MEPVIIIIVPLATMMLVFFEKFEAAIHIGVRRVTRPPIGSTEVIFIVSRIASTNALKQGYALFAAASPVMRRGVALAGWARLIPVLFQRVNISDHAHRVNCSTYFYNIESIK